MKISKKAKTEKTSFWKWIYDGIYNHLIRKTTNKNIILVLEVVIGSSSLVISLFFGFLCLMFLLQGVFSGKLFSISTISLLTFFYMYWRWEIKNG